ncbi:uncharacterized protein LOC126967171 isoform X1 [Leptidea sinapis]|uniref:uncharacterized protein LOC126967171 isoform X1 n=1 Tax=Leptidea sinapis TaxID=189913 RepID=UPI0021348623|nr:uncharacterized protein LOC126967171 isoform X1 [Leptidea sinapis]
MNNFAFLLIICSAINTETGSVNYCGSRMCGHTDRHTFCKYQPGPGATCAGYIEAPLSSAEKENVLARLNRRRSDAAMGLDDWPPAGNMLKLMWVNELAREAQLWADQCIPPASVEEHDECRHLYSVTVGQCVASVVGEAPGLRPETMVDMWFMQRISYVGNLTSYMLSTTYQDFAQIVWSRAFLVGCARSRFMAEMRGRMRTVERLVCNFAPQGPALNRPLWALGEPASLCPSRAIPDKEYPALCVFQITTNETDDIKQIMTHEEHLLLDTVFEIENNLTLDYMGSLDEQYLTKVAISNFGIQISSASNYNNTKYSKELSRRDNSTTASPFAHKIDMNTYVKINNYTKTTKEIVNLIGRPKSYHLEDLQDTFPEHSDSNLIIEESGTDKKYLYIDYEFVETTNEQESQTSVTILAQDLPSHDENATENARNIESLANSYYLNDSLIDDKMIDDYLSDPDAYQRVQQELQRMETMLSTPSSTSASKVRRELRNYDQPTKYPDDAKTKQLLAEIERNKTIERGPMLNMVLKYVPLLKPYEKSILGSVEDNGVARLVPTTVLLVAVCL